MRRCAALPGLVVLLLLGVAARAARAGPEEVAARAAEVWAAGRYDEAARLWAGLIEAGRPTADLYYDLGNALYRAGRPAEAAVAWGRALRLDPRDGDARANLDHVLAALPGRLTWDEGPGWMFWRSTFSPWEQGWAAALLVAAAGALFLVGRWRPGFQPAVPAALLLVPGLLLAVSVALEVRDEALHPHGIVLAEAVEAASAPGAGGVVLFRLERGAEVRVEERLGDRLLASLPDGRRGWVPAAALGLLDPLAPLPSWEDGAGAAGSADAAGATAG